MRCPNSCLPGLCREGMGQGCASGGRPSCTATAPLNLLPSLLASGSPSLQLGLINLLFQLSVRVNGVRSAKSLLIFSLSGGVKDVIKKAVEKV